MVMHDVTGVKVLTPPRLELCFDDGRRGIVDIRAIVGRFDGVFAPLADEAYFRRVSLNPELGTIGWPNGADLCPDVLYAHAIEHQPLDA